jgi:hypothetical protein
MSADGGRTWVVRIRTKDGGIVGHVVWATDRNNAEYKTLRQYPGAVIIEVKPK